MATFSENQVRHLYVVEKDSDFSVSTIDGDLFFNFKNADGEAVRSDILTNIMYAKPTPAEKMQRKLNTWKITANDADMVAGQDYVVKINYRKFISQSDEDTHLELASARAKATGKIDGTDNKNRGTLLLTLAENLEKNTKAQGLVEVVVLYSNAEKSVAYAKTQVTSSAGNAANISAIIIREKVQDWALGVRQEEAVVFNVTSAPIIKDTADYDWATITDETKNQAASIGNGKKTADMEYFYHGERGDIYREKGWPNYIPTKYMVDATKQYDYIDIHYAYVGSNHAVQKSEKDITLVMPAGTVASADHTVAASVLAKINAANKITIVEPDEWNAE